MAPLPDEELAHVDRHVGALWAGLRGARVFITGGTGFFGTWLLESFLWANAGRHLDAQAVVLTRDAAAFRSRCPHLGAQAAVMFHAGDVRSFADPTAAFTHVIHAATPSTAFARPDDPAAVLDVVVRGTERTLEFARRAGVRRFLLVSSGAVYGRQPPELSHVPEEYAGGPDSMDVQAAYGEGKRVAEMLGAVYHARYGLPVTVARCFAFLGPHLPLDAHFAVGNFIRDGLRGGPVRVSGDGTPSRSYLYAADLAAWLWTILLKGEACRPYNVGSDEALSIAELGREVAGRFGVAVEVAGRAAPGVTAARYVPSIERARRELGLDVRIGLTDALERTIRWHRCTGVS
jgi:dTDP-glucose 4,6-dehydratase